MNVRCQCGKTYRVVEVQREALRCHMCGRTIPLAWRWWEQRTDPINMFARLQETSSPRQYFLFGAAVYRTGWSELTDAERAAVELVEAHADGRVPAERLTQAEGGVAVARPFEWGHHSHGSRTELPARVDVGRVREVAHAFRFAYAAAAWVLEPDLMVDASEVWIADILRCVCGNPYRPLRVESGWRSETALQLARVIEAKQSFDLMPVLADAVEEAGCDDEWVLAHCRGTGPHARGCRVIDAWLGWE